MADLMTLNRCTMNARDYREAYRADAIVIRQLQRRLALQTAMQRVLGQIEAGVIAGIIGWLTFEWMQLLVSFAKAVIR